MPPADLKDSPKEAAPEVDALNQVLAHGRELGEDLLGWIELRIQQERLSLSEEVDRRVNLLIAEANVRIAQAILGGLLSLAGGLVLIAACLGLGTVLGHPAWGFLVMGVFFALLGGLIYLVKPPFLRRFMLKGSFDLEQPVWNELLSREAVVDEKRLSDGAPMGQPVAEEKKEGKA